MSLADLFAPEPDVAAHPAVAAAHRLAAEMLEPHAPEGDLPPPAGGVRRDHLEALADEGLLGVHLPVEFGGLGAPPAVDREVVEILAGACGATWFVATQHRMSTTLIPHAAPAVRDRWVGPLVSARTLAGTAFTHLRRPGPPQLTARPDGDGWVLDGSADWCTGWGLLDVFVVGGQAPDGRLVFVLLPMGDRPGLASAPLDLSVMAGTHTVRVELSGLRAGAEDVLLCTDPESWLAVDSARTTNTTPAALGLLRRVLIELAAVGHTKDSAGTVAAATALAAEAIPLRRRVYELLDHADPADRVAERAELRAAVGELTLRAAAALVAAQGGGAVLRTAPAQRWGREALFHLVQAQTAPVRAAMLRHVAATAGARPHSAG